MKQNITLSLDKDLIKKGKVLASRRAKSLSRFFSEFLEQAINEESAYESSRRKALILMEKGYHLGGKTTASREDLHAR